MRNQDQRKERKLNRITRQQSAFPDFEGILQAGGNYRPTIELSSWDRYVLAHEYDLEQERRGDPRRAHTYCNAAMLADEIRVSHYEAVSMNEYLDGMPWEAHDCIGVWANQAERDAFVLATIGKDLILEYEMPNGSSALLQFTVKNRKLTKRRNINYNAVPKRWITAIREAGTTDWIGKGQRSAQRIPFPG